MATKLQFYSAVAEQTVKELTERRGNWMHFLETASRLYKYPFPDQMMIFAQRPDAIACAPIELWNESFDRWVRRGSKGIALIDDTGSYPRLKYVFDVNDTEPSRYNARPVRLWEMRSEHREAVLNELAKSYDDVGDTLTESFHNIAHQLATEYYNDNARDIHYRAEDSFLEARTVYDFAGSPIEDADDGALGTAFVDALTKSVAFSLMHRCGFDTSEHFDDEDFQIITDFNTPDMVYALGTATNELSAQVLRDIELVIKKYERVHAAKIERSEQNYDQNPYLQPSRGLSSARSGAEHTAYGADRAVGEIRTDEESLSERTQDNQLQSDAADREAISAPSGSGAGSDGTTRTDDERPDRTGDPAGQSERPNGLGSGDEHAESTSGGNGTARTDLQLEEQAGAAEEAAPISMAELAHYHSDWNRYVINGILSNETVINAAVNSDRQNTETEISSTIRRLKLSLGQSIIDSTTIENKGALISEVNKYFNKDRNPPLTEQLYDTVIDSDAYRQALAESATPSEQEQSQLVANEPSTFSQLGKSSIQEILSTSSVSIDEVDSILRSGGNFANHKLNIAPFNSRSTLRIAAHFSKGLDNNTDYLKREYLSGIYGRSYTESGKGFDFSNHRICAWFTETGIELATGNTAKNNIRKVIIPWENAAARIQELMREGQYVSKEVFDNALINAERELADKLWSFYRDDMHHIPEEWRAERGGHPEDVAIIQSLLANEDTRQAIRDRLEADVTEWLNDPNSRSWHSPRRLLEEMNAAMHPPVILPSADSVETKPYSFFLTQDEIDAVITRGGNYSEGKMRFLSFFLHDHDQKEKLEFVKQEYGHGGGTWQQTDGWQNAEPGKGLTIQRGGIGKPDAEINLKWPAVIKRTEQLIGSGQYMTRNELDSIPRYERLELARKLNRFYYALPDEYERPFPGKSSGIYPNEYHDENGERSLDFHYPHEAEWQAIRDLLDNPERVESLLSRMQYIFDNTPEEDRHYDYKKAGIEALTAYHNGTYTLFPGLDNLPEPGTVQPLKYNETVIDLNERDFMDVPQQPAEQLSLFGIMQPQLPSINEQIAKIDQSLEQEAVDADAPFLSISQADKARIAAQISANPRSHQAATLVREIYGDSLGIPLPQIIKRLMELVKSGAFNEQQEPPALIDRVRDELSKLGYMVSDELIENGIEEYIDLNDDDNFRDIANFIEIEYLMEEDEPEYDMENPESSNELQSDELAADDLPANQSTLVEQPELDFDTATQTLLERVMADEDYSAALSTAQSRAALRSPLTTAIDKAVLELNLEKQYYSDDDFNDSLFDFVLKQSWEKRPQAQAFIEANLEATAATEAVPMPTAEKLLSAGGTDYYLFHFPEATETPVALSRNTLSLISEKAEEYVICADVCYLSDEEMAQYGIEFRKIPRDFELLPEAMQVKIAAIRPEYEDLLNKKAPEIPVQTSLPPVFFVDWEKAQYDFDLKLYQDRDVIGYNKDGVKTELGRSGNFTYITTTGLVWGGNEVPGDIYEQIQAYKNGDVTDEQVRENYLKTLENFKNYRAADLVKQDYGILADVMSNGLFVGEGKKNILWQLGNGITNNDLAVHLLERWQVAPTAMTLKSGETVEYSSSASGVFIDVQGEPGDKLAYAWTAVVPVLRTLAQQWQVEQTAELSEPSVQKPPRFIEKPIENIGGVLGNHPAFDRISSNDKPYGVWDTVSGDWVRDNDGHVSFNSEMGAEADAEQLNAESSAHELPLPVADIQHTPPPPQQSPAAINFRITDDHLGEGGAKTKFRYNIEAIKTLQAIEYENRSATPDEQETLSRYVGWGGIQQAFDPNDPQWAKEYQELNALLTPEEWDSARASVLNAHYTSPTVIRAIYEAVERMGFTKGNILEPACGVGNFLGLLPDSMKAAKLYGVELDSVTARIAKLLYPKADIKETGYEKTDMPDSFFDLAIGNVPFGDYGIADKRYDKHHFKVHDYFFGKTLDQVRPGGIIAFVTSKGTLDKQNPEVRKYIAQRAELLGAVRLPNTAFLKNAGTEVTSDIIFLQKRDRPLDIEPDWVHLGLTEDGIPVNRYFADNPEMILGTMSRDSGTRMYGDANSTTCVPFEGADLAEQLKTALSYIQGEFTAPELDDIDGVDNHAIPADSNVKNFSYALIKPATEPDNADGQIYAAKIGEGQVYFRENSMMYPVDLPATTLERIKGMIALRDCVHRLIQLQLDDHSETEISEQQQELNNLYDSFIAEFGLINSTANNRAFNADSAYYLLSSLEILDEEGNLARKADMFTKRVRP